MSVVIEASRRRVLFDLGADLSTGAHTASLLLVTLTGAAIYGAALGAWHGPRLALFAAIKVPILLVGTAAITALFNWIVASFLGLNLKMRQTFAVSLVPLAIAATVVASVAPALLFFALSLPPPTPAQQTLHNLLYLLHVAVLAGAGLAGTSALRDLMLSLCDGRASLAAKIRFSWIAAYAFTGGELAWALRPFVGSVHLPVVFLREDALYGNVYEFILTDIAPHLWRTIVP